MNFVFVTPEPPARVEAATAFEQQTTPRRVNAARPAHPVARVAHSANKRWSERVQVYKMGVVSANGLEPIGCTVVNLSKFGALLETTAPNVPDAFVLVFTSNRLRSEVSCMVRWRHGARIGVHFAGPIHTTVDARRAI